MPDTSDLPEGSSSKRIIVYHASKDALGPKTDVILSRLGYQMLLPRGDGGPFSVIVLAIQVRARPDAYQSKICFTQYECCSLIT